VKISAAQAREVAQLLRAAAGAEILPRFRRLAAGDIRTKSGPLDLVTEADEAAERHIEAGLRRIFPKAVIVGEEAAAADPGKLARMAEAQLCIVVDPVDGTANFAAGVPLFGVMAAAVFQGETIAAWIHDPMGDDTLMALRGEGAWVEGQDGHLHDCRVAPPAPLARMIGAISWGFMPRDRKAAVLPKLAGFASVMNFRCAAHEYRLVNTGGAHVLVYNRLLPWDHAAGVLIHAEAGGYSAQFDGAPYSPLRHTGGLICAPDRAGWQEVQAWLLG
jgi:fructose-1,6-bisphosphatase/inositol monophosphatase family enzyme